MADSQEKYDAEESKKRKLDEENNDSAIQLSRDDLKVLLEPLSKEQLVALLVDAGYQYSAIADDIRDVASKDPAHRKLFVRGLAWETTSDALRDVFQQYGEIEEGAVIVDKNTGKSRGYGFITFKHMDSAQRALKEPSKFIDGRIAVCNLAVTGTHGPVVSGDLPQRKLFIGGLSYETTTETLINLFSQYGEIEEGSVAYDKATNKSRGFAFMTFKSVEGARRALSEANKTIEGCNVVIKLAMEGQKDKPQAQAATSQTVSPLQPGFPVNPNIAPYPRAQLQPNAGPVGVAGYPSSYSSQSSYATQYGAVGAGGQYGSAPYPQFGGGYAASQAVQPVHATNILPGYYGSAP